MQKKIADESYGNILVAGYGLGIIQKYLTENKNVTSVTTIEKHVEVINICKKEYGKIYGNIIDSDFYTYDNSIINDKWDCVIGDIWDDIIPEQLPKYIKFKEQALTMLKPNGKLLGWGKDYFEYLIKQKWMASGIDADLGDGL